MNTKPIAAFLLAALLSQEASAWITRQGSKRMAVDAHTEDAALIYSCNGEFNIIRGDLPAPLISMAVDDKPVYVSSEEPHVAQSDTVRVVQVSMSPPLDLLIDMLDGEVLRIAWNADTVLEFDITGFWESLVTLNCTNRPEQRV
jgi:hypothetical protein